MFNIKFLIEIFRIPVVKYVDCIKKIQIWTTMIVFIRAPCYVILDLVRNVWFKFWGCYFIKFIISIFQYF